METTAIPTPELPGISPGTLQAMIEKAIDERLDDLVQSKIAKEEDKRFRQLKWIVAFVGLIGLGTFGTLANYLIQQAVDVRAGHVSQSLDLLRIDMLALKLDMSKSFTQEDSHAVMILLEKISHNDEARALPEFPATLVKVLRAFAAASRDANVDRLFELYQHDILSSSTMVETLLQHYGEAIIGREAGTVRSEDDTALRNFESLEKLAQSSHVPEVALNFRILFDYRHSLKHPSDDVLGLISRAQYLGDEDFAAFIVNLLTFTQIQNWDRPSTQSRAIEAVTRHFLGDYADALAKQFQVKPEEVQAWSKKGISREDAKQVADEVTSKRHVM